MGVLNSTVGAGDMTMQDLANVSAALGPALQRLQRQHPQAGAALATFGDNNIRGAKAGTQLRMAVQAMADPILAGQSQLKAWGISSGNLTKQLEHGGLTDALDTLKQKMLAAGITAKSEGPALTEIFGKRAGVGIMTLEDELDRYHNKLKEVTDGGNSFAASWKGYTKTFGYALDSARAAAESLLISLGEKLLPSVTKLANWIADKAIPALQRFADYLERNQKAAVELGVAVGAFLVIFGGPITVIGTLATAFVVLYEKSETFRNVIKQVGRDAAAVFKALESAGKAIAPVLVSAWHGMETAGVAVWHAIGAVYQWFADGPVAYVRGVIDVFTTWWTAHFQSIATVTRVVWGVISNVIVTQWRVAWDLLQPALKLLEATFKTVWDAVKTVVTTTLSIIGTALKTAEKVFLDFVGVVLDLLTGKWGQAWSDAKNLVSTAFTGIGKILETFTSGALNLLWQAGVNIVEGLVNGITSMAKAPLHAIESIGSGMSGIFKKFHLMSSPSKLYFQYGMWIVEGLVNGIRRTR